MIIAFIPCRLKSTRLPNKAIQEIHGIPAIERCLLNALAVEKCDKVVLATSLNPEDDALVNYTLNGRVELVRGSEEDVLSRFMPVIERDQPEHVIRITGDCPVISYEIIGRLIDSHLATGADATFTKSAVPIGTTGEVYRAEAIRKLKTMFPVTDSSEYLVWYFMNNPHIFNLNNPEIPAEYQGSWRLTLDEREDLELFDLMFRTLDIGERAISFPEIRDFFAQHPEAAAINQHIGVKYNDNLKLIERLKKATTFNLV